MRTKVGTIVWTLLVVPLSGAAQQAAVAEGEGNGLADEVVVTRTTEAIAVDGVLDERGWEEAAVVSLPWEIAPGDNEPTTVTTRCIFTHDSERLYLGCRARDPDPSSIRAFISDRDELDGQDRIVLLLDLFNDSRRAVEFSISPLGVQADAFRSQSIASSGDPDGSERDGSWDAIWSSSGRITESGYVVEAAIPFHSLRFPREQGDRRWGFRITRWWPRARGVQLSSVPMDRDNACDLCQLGKLRGLRGMEPGRNVEVTPTLTAGRTDHRPAGASTIETGSVQGDIGTTVTWGVTPGITLNATVNPDFSQVEADVAQLDVNSPVALFFPEKRPFFLEGADLFATPLRAVFTRTIADPSAGGKVSGKLGRNGLGLLVARDADANLLIPGVQTSTHAVLPLGPTTLVARLTRDVGESSSIGALYVGREGGEYSNRVVGPDIFLRPVPSLQVRLQYLRSRTRYPQSVATAHDQPAGPFFGDAVEGHLNWSNTEWIFNTSFGTRTGGFRADAGFVPSVGRRGGNISLHRQFWGGRDTWYSRLRLQVGTWRSETQSGELIDGDGMWIGLEYEGPGQTSVRFFPNPFFRTSFAGTTYSMASYYWSIGARPRSGLTLSVDGEWGDAIDFNNARKADNVLLGPSVELRLGRRTDLRVSHSFQRLSTGGSSIVRAHLTQLRAVYNFSARSFIRAIMQLRAVDRDPALYSAVVDERSLELFTQLLYSYKLNPESVLFLGYADDLRGTAITSGDDLDLGRAGRSFFFKLSYAWRP